MKKTLRIISVFSLAMLLSLPATFAEEWKAQFAKITTTISLPPKQHSVCLQQVRQTWTLTMFVHVSTQVETCGGTLRLQRMKFQKDRENTQCSQLHF